MVRVQGGWESLGQVCLGGVKDAGLGGVEVEELLVRLARGGAFTLIYIKLLTKLMYFRVTG